MLHFLLRYEKKYLEGKYSFLKSLFTLTGFEMQKFDMYYMKWTKKIQWKNIFYRFFLYVMQHSGMNVLKILKKNGTNKVKFYLYYNF